MATEKPRFSITVSEELYDEINRYQHENRISTQTKAIAQILQVGVTALSVSLATEHKKPDFLPGCQQLSGEILNIIEIYDSLNEEGHSNLLNYAETLTYNPKYKKCNSIPRKTVV